MFLVPWKFRTKCGQFERGTREALRLGAVPVAKHGTISGVSGGLNEKVEMLGQQVQIIRILKKTSRGIARGYKPCEEVTASIKN